MRTGPRVLPRGATSWEDVTTLRTPDDQRGRFRRLPHAPWPFTADELARIERALPANSPDYVFELIIVSAANFLHRMRLKQRRPSKANPAAELQRIDAAIAELLTALSAAGPRARQHLEANPSPIIYGDRTMSVFELARQARIFRRDNRAALEALPEGVAMGAPAKPHEEWLIWQLWTAWTKAHGDAPPRSGWPEFLEACADPLRQSGLPARDRKSWQDLLKRAKARARKEGISRD